MSGTMISSRPTNTSDLGDIPSVSGPELGAIVNGIFTREFKSTYPGREFPYGFRTTKVKAEEDRLKMEVGMLFFGVYKNELHYLNTEVFPIEITDDVFFKIDVTEIVDDGPHPVGPSGIPREMQETQYTIEGKSTRFGMLLRMDGDHSKIKEGVKNFSIRMKAMAGKFKRLSANLAVSAIFASNPDRRSLLDAPGMNVRTYDSLVLARRDRFGAAYKTKYGLSNSLLKDRQEITDINNGLAPSLVLFPNEKRQLIAGMSQYVDADKAGDNGPKLLMGDEDITMWQRMRLRTVPQPIDVFTKYDMLTRERRIGNFVYLEHFADQTKSADQPGWYLADAEKNDDVYKRTEDLVVALPFVERLSATRPDHETSLKYRIMDKYYETLLSVPNLRERAYEGNDRWEYSPGLGQHVSFFMEAFEAFRDTLAPPQGGGGVFNPNELDGVWNLFMVSLFKYSGVPADGDFHANVVSLANHPGHLGGMGQAQVVDNGVIAANNVAIQSYLGIDVTSNALTQKIRSAERVLSNVNPGGEVLTLNYVLVMMKLSSSFRDRTPWFMDLLGDANLPLGIRNVFAGSILGDSVSPRATTENVYIVNLVDLYNECAGPLHQNEHFMAGNAPFYIDKTTRYPMPGVFTPSLYAKDSAFLCLRPFETLSMQSYASLIPGKDTGATYISDPNITSAQDSASQVKQLSWTQWAHVQVYQPKRIRVTHDAFYNGFTGGGNTKVISVRQARLMAQNNWTINNQRDPSMIVLPIRRGTFYPGPYIHVTKKPRMSLNDPDNEEEDFEGAGFFAELYDYAKANNEFEVEEGTRYQIASVCFPARHGYLRENGSTRWIPGQTHHGPHGELPGTRSTKENGVTPFPGVNESIIDT